MKILCYGDSNTWGYVPNIDGYSKNAIVKQYSQKDCWWFGLTKNNEVFVNGLCGRCIAHENKWLADRNASKTIKNELKQYSDLDCIIVQLGTNDCKTEYGDTPLKITSNIKNLLDYLKKQTGAKIILISPAMIIENNKITKKYYVGGQKKSQELDYLYRQLAQKNGYTFVSGVDLEIGEDGEHLTINGHKELNDRILYALNKISNKDQQFDYWFSFLCVV